MVTYRVDFIIEDYIKAYTEIRYVLKDQEVKVSTQSAETNDDRTDDLNRVSTLLAITRGKRMNESSSRKIKIRAEDPVEKLFEMEKTTV